MPFLGKRERPGVVGFEEMDVYVYVYVYVYVCVYVYVYV